MNKQIILDNTGDFHELLITSLKEPENAEAYLSVALEEYQEDNDTQAFLLALKNVAEAQGGLGKLAANTALSRQNLYKVLSDSGNPRLTTLNKILKGLGFHLSIEKIKKAS